jgi:hypothetical protein
VLAPAIARGGRGEHQVGVLAPALAAAAEGEHQLGVLAPALAAAAEIEHQLGERWRPGSGAGAAIAVAAKVEHQVGELALAPRLTEVEHAGAGARRCRLGVRSPAARDAAASSSARPARRCRPGHRLGPAARPARLPGTSLGISWAGAPAAVGWRPRAWRTGGACAAAELAIAGMPGQPWARRLRRFRAPGRPRARPPVPSAWPTARRRFRARSVPSAWPTASTPPVPSAWPTASAPAGPSAPPVRAPAGPRARCRPGRRGRGVELLTLCGVDLVEVPLSPIADIFPLAGQYRDHRAQGPRLAAPPRPEPSGPRPACRRTREQLGADDYRRRSAGLEVQEAVGRGGERASSPRYWWAHRGSGDRSRTSLAGGGRRRWSAPVEQEELGGAARSVASG